jgi:hypothetical protein
MQEVRPRKTVRDAFTAWTQWTLLAGIETLSERIGEYNERIEKLAQESYPQVARLQQVKGVGTLIALTFLLTLEDAQRFRKSRDVQLSGVAAHVVVSDRISEGGQKSRPLSPHHRFVIAMHSPDGVLESGLLGCLPEKKVRKPACRIGQDAGLPQRSPDQ